MVYAQLFKFKEHEINAYGIDGKLIFWAPDVCKILGIEDADAALERLDEDERSFFIPYNIIYVNYITYNIDFK